MRDLLSWLADLRPDHPAHGTVVAAETLGRRVSWRHPVPLATIQDPVVWLAVWWGGGIVRWSPEAGLSGWAHPLGSVSGAKPQPAALDAPAVIWEGRVFSHRAVWAAIEDVHALGAAGWGLKGPAGFVQRVASWMAGSPYGAGSFLYPAVNIPRGWTNGSVSWLECPELLGPWARVDPAGHIEPGRATWMTSEGIRSRRLYGGYWNGAEMRPEKFYEGWWNPPWLCCAVDGPTISY